MNQETIIKAVGYKFLNEFNGHKVYQNKEYRTVELYEGVLIGDVDNKLCLAMHEAGYPVNADQFITALKVGD